MCLLSAGATKEAVEAEQDDIMMEWCSVCWRSIGYQVERSTGHRSYTVQYSLVLG